jgi:hypothetical protein
MRGAQLLFSNLIQSDSLPRQKSSDKGRSKDLINKRDQKLLYRHYFYAQILRKQYADVINRLREEFDLSDVRIIVCLSDKHQELKAIFAAKPSVRDLKELYPYLNWDLK